MKVGDLVTYRNSAYPSRAIGMVTAVNVCTLGDEYIAYPYRIRWTDHTKSNRDWYHESEIALLRLGLEVTHEED